MGQWRPGDPVQTAPNDRLKVVTWNIWFGDYRWSERLDALIEKVGLFLPDVIGLQEVTPHQLSRLLDHPWVRRQLAVSDATGETLRPHGVLLLSRLPLRDLELIELPSELDRKLLIAEVDTGRGPLILGVTHLESGSDQAERRREQLDLIQRRLLGRGASLLMGDLNFDADNDPERRWLSPAMNDCWRAVHLRAPGYTLDSRENGMRASFPMASGSMRCDCIMLSAEAQTWQAEQIWRLGLEPISYQNAALYPSDHFGLAATFVPRRH